jgi:hypothetical protein
MQIKLYDEVYDVELVTNRYVDGGMAVLLTEQGMPFSTISVRLPETDMLPDDVFFVKHWSENAPVVEQLISMGLLERIEDVSPASSGMVDEIYAYRLKGK